MFKLLMMYVYKSIAISIAYIIHVEEIREIPGMVRIQLQMSPDQQAWHEAPSSARSIAWTVNGSQPTRKHINQDLERQNI